MPRGVPKLPRVHQLQITDDESRLIGLSWDKMIAEVGGNLALAIDYAGCIREHIVTMHERMGDEEFFAFLLATKKKFDALWEIHGCACGNPDCGHNADNPDNDLGGFSGLDIN